MRSSTRVIGAAVVAFSLMLSACQAPAPAPHDGEEPSHIEHIDGTDLTRVTITEKAAERIDLQTTEVFEQVMPRSSAPATCVPYSSLIYDSEGRTWVYISDAPRSFVREAVVIDYIEGDVAVLSSGPSVGAVVAAVGVAELYGTEFEVGH